MNDSNDAVLTLDLEGRIETWNPAAERIYGYSAAEAIGQAIELVLPEPELEPTYDLIRQVRGGKRAPPRRVRRRTKDGTEL